MDPRDRSATVRRGFTSLRNDPESPIPHKQLVTAEVLTTAITCDDFLVLDRGAIRLVS